MKNEYEIRGDVTAIFLRRKDGSVLETLIDTKNLEKVKQLTGRWYALPDKHTFYVRGYFAKTKRVKVQLHRFLTDAPENMVVDHINHNGLDNRLSNLRIVKAEENAQNKLKPYMGATWDANMKKWRARVRTGGKEYLIGYYDNIEEAANAASKARMKLLPYSLDAFYGNIFELHTNTINAFGG